MKRSFVEFHADKNKKHRFLGYHVCKNKEHLFWLICTINFLASLFKHWVCNNWIWFTYTGIDMVQNEHRPSNRDLIGNERPKLYFILPAGYRYSSVWSQHRNWRKFFHKILIALILTYSILPKLCFFSVNHVLKYVPYCIFVYPLCDGLLVFRGWLYGSTNLFCKNLLCCLKFYRMILFFKNFQEYSSCPYSWKKEQQRQVARGWNSSGYWRKLDNLPCM